MEGKNEKINKLLSLQKEELSSVKDQEKKIRSEFLYFFLFTLTVILVGFYGGRSNGFPLLKSTWYLLETFGVHLFVFFTSVYISLFAAFIFTHPQVVEKNLHLVRAEKYRCELEKERKEIEKM